MLHAAFNVLFTMKFIQCIKDIQVSYTYSMAKSGFITTIFFIDYLSHSSRRMQERDNVVVAQILAPRKTLFLFI